MNARKLALLYATLERTLPSITAEQIAAAIKVANFGFRCAKRLIHGRVEYSVQGRCERDILAALKADKLPAWKIHHQIGGGKFTAFDLERALKALTSTGAIEIVGHSGRGSEIYRARGTTRKA